jgi:hypothetical protein
MDLWMFCCVLQVEDGESWSYDAVEDDHMGTSRHAYEGTRTRTGFTLRRSHTSDEHVQRQHNRVRNRQYVISSAR